MRAKSQQVGFCFRHTFIYSLFCNICFISYSQKYVHSLRFIAVLDDCNDSKEAGNNRVQEEGEGARKRRLNGAKGKDSRKAREGKEEEREKKEREKGEGRKGEKEKRETKGEGSEGERALLASVVHVARALYMNVTQDVAVGLSCILCTTTLDYPEYHARIRLIIQNTMHDYD